MPSPKRKRVKMPDPVEESKSGPSLYRQFLDERDEILKYKWVRSEEVGHDIGFETALINWTRNHREQWKKDYFKSSRN